MGQTIRWLTASLLPLSVAATPDHEHLGELTRVDPIRALRFE